MKHVVSVSLGSSRRDSVAEIDVLGQRLRVERRGTDGSLERAKQMIATLDGEVDVIGLGGIDLYIFAGGKRYTLRDAKKMADVAKKTPVVDGSGLKNSLERWVVRFVQEEGGINLSGKRVLMMAAVDRFGMAEELVESGCSMVFGDLIFTIGIPIPLRSLQSLGTVARMIGPVAVRLPIRMLYPIGKSQEQTVSKHSKHLEDTDIIAGDFHFIRRHLPGSLEGKGILTNTVTEEDIGLLFDRGLSFLVTTTPNLGGRSFATNAIEAALVAVSGLTPDQMTPEDYLRLFREMDFSPRIERR